MPLPPEIISALKEKAAVEKRAREDAKIARQQAEKSDKSRADTLLEEIKGINSQLKTDGQLKEGLRLSIEKNPRRANYFTENDTIIGLPIAQSYSQAVVLTPMGIKAFEIHRQITWPGEAQALSFSAEDMTLGFADIGKLFPPEVFPSAEALRQKIKTFLGNQS